MAVVFHLHSYHPVKCAPNLHKLRHTD